MDQEVSSCPIVFLGRDCVTGADLLVNVTAAGASPIIAKEMEIHIEKIRRQ
jgi:hypothetical protein